MARGYARHLQEGRDAINLTDDGMKTARTYGLAWQSPAGALTVYEDNGTITAVDFGFRNSGLPADTPLLREAQRQISAYLNGRLRAFDLPYDISCGTAFQQKVWKALSEIPYGETATYADIAQSVGNIRAVRAVGMANHCNPLPLIIPCHRVIGKDGSLMGYAGGPAIKKYLLDLEQK